MTILGHCKLVNFSKIVKIGSTTHMQCPKTIIYQINMIMDIFGHIHILIEVFGLIKSPKSDTDELARGNSDWS